MPNPPSRKDAWKAAAASGSPAQPVDKPWRNDKAEPSQRPPWWKSRRARFAFVTSGLLMVAMGILWVVIWYKPPKPLHLVLMGAGYEDNLAVPSHVAGRKSLEGLLALAKENKNWDGQVTSLDVGGDADDVKHALAASKTPKLIVFVSAHGIARGENGELVPFLVRQNDNLSKRETLYKLDDLLDALNSLPDTQKLLLVDTTQVRTPWTLGQLHNDFLQALKNRLNGKSIRNLVVISSSAEDQRAWASPEWGQTVFAHYVMEGLRGAADQTSETNGNNGRVDARELYAYVRAKVDHWARHNRAQVQTPMLLFGTEQQAANMELVAHRKDRAETEPNEWAATWKDKDETEEKDYEDLRKAWKTCRELEKESPHPAVYTPHLWRRYLDTLLRAEQLLRSGDSAAALKHLQRLPSLGNAIKNARVLKQESLQLTLAMPAALGASLTQKERSTLAEIERLWDENAGKKDFDAKVYEKARSALLNLAAEDRTRQRMLHAVLSGLVVRKVAEDPAQRLIYGHRLLHEWEANPPYCRPAETHHLLMMRLETASDKSPPVDLLQSQPDWAERLKQSIQVRLLAEQAALGLGGEMAGERLAAYSEQVLPWIKPVVESADASRRLGEDLLFTSLDAKWDEAKKQLEKARLDYVRAQHIAADLRRALSVRDRVLVELPYYTGWVAEQQPDREKSVISLWGQVHALRRQLRQGPAIAGATLEQSAAKLGKLAQEIRRDFEELREGKKDSLRASAHKRNAHHQDRWHEIEAILSVPFLDADERLDLLKASRDISRDLFVNPDKESEASTGVERTVEEVRKVALRQGRLALAVVGRDNWPGYAAAEHDIGLAEGEDWHRPVRQAGENLGAFLNSLPEKTDQLCQQASAMDDLSASAELLRQAVNNAHLLEGAAVEERMKRDPVGEQRRIDLHDLLCWQAQRTYLDWWAEQNQTPLTRPYFQRAGDLFLKDAEELVRGKSAAPDAIKRSKRLARIDEVYKKLRQRAVVEMAGGLSRGGDFQTTSQTLDLTDEGRAERFYRLRGPDKKNMPGVAVMWIDPPASDAGLQVVAEEAGRHTEEFDRSVPLQVVEKSVADRRGKGVATYRANGFFRGHRASLTTEVRMYREPDVTLSLPPRRGGGTVAVQTRQDIFALYGPENTAISIVLDCSGSMNYRRRKGDPTRFRQATRALKSVLQDVPEGVTVSLRAFGASTFGPKVELPEKERIRLLWEAHKWNPARRQVDKRMREVEDLEPYYWTPLLRSIRMASEDFPRDFPSRTIVVLTDGGDSEFNDPNKDKDLKKISGANTIADYVKHLKKEFDDSGIQLIVIGFDVKANQLDPKEVKSYEEFKKAMNDLGGVYEDAENATRLATMLRDSLLRSYFRVDPDLGASAAGWRPDRGRIISRSDRREPAHYVPVKRRDCRVRVPSTRLLQQRIAVGPGDALLLDLVKNVDTSRPAFRRSTYAESDVINLLHGREHVRKAEPVDNWLLAVLQNQQQRERNDLHMLATLEKEEGIANPRTPVQLVHPQWCWFEVGGATGAAPPLRITPAPNYPASAWGLELPRWQPWGAPVTLKAWWREELPKPHGRLIKNEHFQSPFEANLLNREWPTEAAGEVLLESIRIEKLPLRTAAGQAEEQVDCLTVRLRYNPAKGRFFVRWPGWDGGQEHRFYTEAGKYTGIFWSDKRNMKDQAEQELKGLDLYSVRELKSTALQVKELKVGSPNDIWGPPAPAPRVRYSIPE